MTRFYYFYFARFIIATLTIDDSAGAVTSTAIAAADIELVYGANEATSTSTGNAFVVQSTLTNAASTTLTSGVAGNLYLKNDCDAESPDCYIYLDEAGSQTTTNVLQLAAACTGPVTGLVANRRPDWATDGVGFLAIKIGATTYYIPFTGAAGNAAP